MASRVRRKVARSKIGEPQCEACAGRGRFAPASPSCDIPALQPPWIVVERCDACGKHEDDLSAALSVYVVAAWFRCGDGGWHALAKPGAAGRRRLASRSAFAAA